MYCLIVGEGKRGKEERFESWRVLVDVLLEGGGLLYYVLDYFFFF